jgi:hypothetical protein
VSPRHFYNLADETPRTVLELLAAAERYRTEPVSGALDGRQVTRCW